MTQYRVGQELCIAVRVVAVDPNDPQVPVRVAGLPGTQSESWCSADRIRHAAQVTVAGEPSTDYCLGYADGLHNATARPHNHDMNYALAQSEDYRRGYVRGFRESLQGAIAGAAAKLNEAAGLGPIED